MNDFKLGTGPIVGSCFSQGPERKRGRMAITNRADLLERLQGFDPGYVVVVLPSWADSAARIGSVSRLREALMYPRAFEVKPEMRRLAPMDGCRWCGFEHPDEHCPRVKSLQFDGDENVTAVEFIPPIVADGGLFRKPREVYDGTTTSAVESDS